MHEQKIFKYRLIIIFGFVGVLIITLVILGHIRSFSNVEWTFNSEMLVFKLNKDEDYPNLIDELKPKQMAKMTLKGFSINTEDDINQISRVEKDKFIFDSSDGYYLYLQSLVLSEGTEVLITHRREDEQFILELYPGNSNSTHYLNFFLKKNNIELTHIRFQAYAKSNSKIFLTPLWDKANNEINFLTKPIPIFLEGFSQATTDGENWNVKSTLTIDSNKKEPFEHEFIQLSPSNSLSLSELFISQDGLRGKLSGHLSQLKHKKEHNQWIEVQFPSLLEKLNFDLAGFEKTITFLALYVITPLYFILGEILLVIIGKQMGRRSAKSNKHLK